MALIFETSVAQNKPDDNRRPTGYCPFCDVEALENILDRDGDSIWLVNKFRTLRDTMQTVIIESARHDGDISTYGRAENRRIFRFALSCWDRMISSGDYASVLMYKNFGPLSGGSLKHPHMQVVGLYHDDGYANVDPKNLAGLPICETQGIEVNASTEPVMGFFEVNVLMPRQANGAVRDAFADAVQETVRYVLNEHHGGRCTSYNLFFYHMMGKTACKVVPRWVTSPYFIGYKLAQVNAPQRMEADAAELRRHLLASAR